MLAVLLRHAPSNDLTAQEALDAVSMAVAFGQPTTLLLLDDGVWQTQPDTIGIEALGNLMDLAEPGTVRIFADTNAMRARGIASDALPDFVQAASAEVIRSQIARARAILSF